MGIHGARCWNNFLLCLLQENFEFKKPSMPASRCRMRSTGGTKDAFACRPNSAPALMVQYAFLVEPVENGSKRFNFDVDETFFKSLDFPLFSSFPHFHPISPTLQTRAVPSYCAAPLSPVSTMMTMMMAS